MSDRRRTGRWNRGLAASLLLIGLLPGLIGWRTIPVALAQNDQEREIPEDAEIAYFVEVVDGDTIRVEMLDDGRAREETVRLIGIDTPETTYAYGNEPECYGKEATNKTESTLLAAEDEIYLEADVEDEDDFGRLLRYVWYVSDVDGKPSLLNETLVAEGYALARTYRPNTKHQDWLDEAERRAISGGRGMWLTCDGSVSMDPDLEEPDGGPDEAPIDRTRTPVSIEEDAVCSLFDYFDEAQDALESYPVLSEILDTDGDGVACEGYFGVK